MESQWNVFHPFKDQEPAWTLREGDWTDDFEKYSKDFRATIGEYYLHSLCTIRVCVHAENPLHSGSK